MALVKYGNAEAILQCKNKHPREQPLFQFPTIKKYGSERCNQLFVNQAYQEVNLKLNIKTYNKSLHLTFTTAFQAFVQAGEFYH